MAEIRLIGTLSGHQDRVWSVAWNPTGTVLASSSGDKTIRLWAEEGSDHWVCKTVLEGCHQRTIRCVSWSPCGRLLAAASFDGTTSIWSNKSADFECIATLEGHENEVKSVAWSASGAYLATCSRDKSVWIFEVDDENENFDCASIVNSHTQDVKCVRWHPNDDILASAGYDDSIKLYSEDGDDWTCFATLESHTSTVWSIDFDSTGLRLVSGSDDKTLKIWKQCSPGNSRGIATKGKHPSWKCVCTLSGYHSRAVYDVRWCRLTGMIASASGDDSIRIFTEDSSCGDEDQPSFKAVAKAETFETNGLSWNPAVPGLLASCSDDGNIRLWKVETVL